MNRETMRAVILGLACGDALGAPTEFSDVARIRRRFGQDGITDLSQTDGRYTDDTQMAVALAEGLLAAHGDLTVFSGNLDPTHDDTPAKAVEFVRDNMTHPDAVMPHVTRAFVSWSKSPENNRAPGNTCMGGCRNLDQGMHWRESGISDSKGCGGIMRVAPVGLLYSTREDILRIAKAQCICTHGHPSAYQAAQLGALAVRLLADRLVEPHDLLETLRSTLAALPNPDPKLTDLLWRVRGALDLVHEDEDTPEGIQQSYEGGPKNLGESWTGHEALASALFCFLLACERGEGYVESACYGANTDGDSDSIACVAGSFAAAWWGLGERGVPQSWIDHVEDTFSLRALADQLYKARL